MGFPDFPVILGLTICLTLTFYLLTRKSFQGKWSPFDTLPWLILNRHRFHNLAAEFLERNGGNLVVKGGWLGYANFLFTADPANIQHITNSNFSNYPKEPHYPKIFDILGTGLFNSDGNRWKKCRKVIHSVLSNPKFIAQVFNTTHAMLEERVVLLLKHASEQDLSLDMQDLFHRFTFDVTCINTTSHDPKSLLIDSPKHPFLQGMIDLESNVLYRVVFPDLVCKLPQFLGLGPEKKLHDASKTIDRFIFSLLSEKQLHLNNTTQSPMADEHVSILSLSSQKKDVVKTAKGNIPIIDDYSLHDMTLEMLLAGGETLSSALTWSLWLILRNPKCQEKIRSELRASMAAEKAEKCHVFQADETNRLVYLHAAICESLRLYPPVPVQFKFPTQPDILPTGHHVHPDNKILIPLYAMGRLKELWGEDGSIFKPDRWISTPEKIKHESPYKFFSFYAGPRICPGKDLGQTQLKMVLATLIHNFQFQVLDDDSDVYPDLSIILRIKNGLKLKARTRWN